MGLPNIRQDFGNCEHLPNQLLLGAHWAGLGSGMSAVCQGSHVVQSRVLWKQPLLGAVFDDFGSLQEQIWYPLKSRAG